MAVTYEWVVEQMDGDDITDTSGFETIIEARAFAAQYNGCVICLRRDVGNDLDGITDRAYAYRGDTEFENGAAIPKRLAADFNTL